MNPKTGGLISRGFYERTEKVVSAAESAGASYYQHILLPRDSQLPPPPPPPAPVPALLPFEVYQLSSSSSSGDDDTGGDSTDTPTTTQPDTGPDWRSNFTVHSGTVSNVIPDNVDSTDDSDGGPVSINFPESTQGFLVWLNCSIDTDDGTVTDATVESGKSGWDGYPKQPQGDETTGDPPDTFYLLIASVNTGSDDPSDDDFHHLNIFQHISTSVWLDMVGWQIQCDALNGIILLKRMSARSV